MLIRRAAIIPRFQDSHKRTCRASGVFQPRGRQPYTPAVLWVTLPCQQCRPSHALPTWSSMRRSPCEGGTVTVEQALHHNVGNLTRGGVALDLDPSIRLTGFSHGAG